MRTRPVFERLPVRGYQDNDTADALLNYYDSKLVATGKMVEDLYLRLNPDTCPPEFLDWLAFMVGMVAPYYSNGWSVEVKRKAVKNANDIFRLRGTDSGIKKALDIHSFQYDLYTSNDLKLAFTFGNSTSRFGGHNDKAYIRLPLEYIRSGYEFQQAEAVSENYSAFVNPLVPCYNRFYIGFSLFDDPLF